MNKKVITEGPDLSAHQGQVDVKRIRDAGCRCIGLRAGYGKNNVDERYVVNAQACCNLDVDVVLYWFSYAYTVEMAEQEADYAIAQAAKYWSTCPIAFDFEYDSVNYARKHGVAVTKRLCTDMTVAFLRRVRDAGYVPVVYANRDYLQNYFDMPEITKALEKVYVWYARYISVLPEDEADAADIWQFTSGGKLAGVHGKVDLNRFYTDFSGSTVRKEQEAQKNLNILDFQIAANEDGIRDQNGARLQEDGLDGPKTRYVRKQIRLRAKMSGGQYIVGSSGQVVRWWQRRCNEILGHHQNTDGLYGQTARKETLALQRKLGLKADGIAGYDSIQAAFYH